MRVCSPRLLLAVLALLCGSAAPALAAWPHDPAVNLPICTASSNQAHPQAVSDGAGGAIITWEDYRSTGSTSDIYAQRVSAAGVAQWAANGVAICAATSDQSSPQIVPDGAGGAIITWYDYRSGGYDVYAQRVNAAGVVQWAVDGVAICTAYLSQMSPALVADGSGGAIIAWHDSRNGNMDVYAQRVNAAGVVQWAADGVALCTAANEQSSVIIAADGAGGAIVAWQDFRSGTNYDAYAQRVNAAGAVQWATNGVAVCTAANHQYTPAVVADGAGGAIFAWTDLRGGAAYDIYAQWLNAAGGAQWTTNGVALCTAGGSQLGPRIISDGVGGAIVAWYDLRSGNNDIYAQRLNSAGAAQWTTDGVAICVSASDQMEPQLVPDGAGGAIVVWSDFQSTNIYAERVNGSGTAQWTPSDGVAISTANFLQDAPTIVTDARTSDATASGAIIAWRDARSGISTDIYAQRIERFGYLGTPEPVIAGVKDVPNDEGGSVKVSWNASYLEDSPYGLVAEYRIFRSVPVSLAGAMLARGLARVGDLGADEDAVPRTLFRTSANGTGYYWEYVATVRADYLTRYSYVAPTSGDSIAGSNPYTAFMVQARTTGNLHWESLPDSGYSVDDLSPATPVLFTGTYAAGSVTLHWRANGEADLAGYRLYRGTTAGFVPGAGNRVAEPTDVDYVDAAGRPYWYKLSAVDVHGNESGYAALLPAGTVDVPGGAPPRELALALGSANPGRGGATLRWALPAQGAARLVVHDVAGRAVRTLVTGSQPAGEHVAAWDGRDETGAPVAAGLYLARLEAMGRALSVRFVLVR